MPVLLATAPRRRLTVLQIVARSCLPQVFRLRPQRAGAGRQSDGPRLPFEDAGACPFEGCVYREWVATNVVQVRRDRTTAAPPAFRVRAGERVTALTGVVVTVRAGRIQFRTAHEALSDAGPIRISAGDTLCSAQAYRWARVSRRYGFTAGCTQMLTSRTTSPAIANLRRVAAPAGC